MEERKINYPTNRKMKKNLIRKGALGLAMALTLSVTPAPKNMVENVTTVEAAKKDKKKPKITLKGQKTLSAEEGEQVTIPATTYSDNKTKKKKLKVGVTVKKGKKNYKALASKIQKATLKSKPVNVTFNEEGTYKITTTVTDLAKNKATATRTVTITPEQIEEQEVITKQDPEVTTESTRKVVTPETPTTTEEPKKEEPVVEDNKRNPIDYSKYNIQTIEIDGNTYRYVRNDDFKYDAKTATEESSKITLNIQNDYDVYMMDIDNNEIDNCNYFRYFGKITAYDEKGNDISDQIVITDIEYKYLKNVKAGYGYIYVKDSNGNELVKEFELDVYDFDDSYTDDYFGKDYNVINSDPKVYARKRGADLSYDEKVNEKKLVMKLL